MSNVSMNPEEFLALDDVNDWQEAFDLRPSRSASVKSIDGEATTEGFTLDNVAFIDRHRPRFYGWLAAGQLYDGRWYFVESDYECIDWTYKPSREAYVSMSSGDVVNKYNDAIKWRLQAAEDHHTETVDRSLRGPRRYREYTDAELEEMWSKAYAADAPWVVEFRNGDARVPAGLARLDAAGTPYRIPVRGQIALKNLEFMAFASTDFRNMIDRTMDLTRDVTVLRAEVLRLREIIQTTKDGS